MLKFLLLIIVLIVHDSKIKLYFNSFNEKSLTELKTVLIRKSNITLYLIIFMVLDF